LRIVDHEGGPSTVFLFHDYRVIQADWRFSETGNGELYVMKDLTKKALKLPVNKKDTSVER
jgi:hypothetical protein